MFPYLIGIGGPLVGWTAIVSTLLIALRRAHSHS